MMLCTMYDPAIYLIDKDFYEKYHYHVNVQSIVEQPNLYILAKFPSNDQQLMYTETRMEDIQTLKEPSLANGIPIKDKLRVFKGDAPAAQFEAGQ